MEKVTSDDVLDCKRFRVTYREETFYVIVAVDEDNNPVEVFAEHATNRDYKLIYMMSGIDTITRFVTMALKTYPLSKTIQQLNKASRNKNDFAGILRDLLKQYEGTSS